ncbi:predicted membrane protein [Fructobacillus pseudoficulneus]|uniref:Predicted membrane protein n=1 Tax=Fructobacillus pseudoficulneus TaxID=220714 RepID=A0A3F3GXX7_9LACO|nr:YoaK family protein [Fructobacillus pseudoficulneus]GAP02932.1 predicted membrane protein [Fructobacillus pseudoficulneus]
MSKNTFPSHERLLFASLLTMTAGSLDAYSYLIHGEVFAGLQTGNLILLGINLGKLHFATAGHYLISLLAFCVGTIIVKMLQHFLKSRGTQAPVEQRTVLLYITALLILSALLEKSVPNIVGTSILSLAAAAALQEFRKLKGAPFMPLMMTGNFRTLYEALYEAIFLKNKQMATKAKDIATVIFTFFAGALMISLLIPSMGGYAILIPALITIMMTWITMIK